jgi:hypothetical protein
MGQFGYQVLGLGGYASRGIAVGVWTDQSPSNGTGENKYAGAHAGTGTSGLYAGGYPYGDGKGTNTFEWGGSSWSSGGSLNNNSHNSMGAGTQSAAIKIAGQDGDGTYQYVEEYNGSSWTNKTSTNNDHSGGTTCGSAVNACIVLLGANPNSEQYNSSGSGSWTDKATDTRRDEMQNGDSGGAGQGMAIAGKDQPGGGDFIATTRIYTLATNAWTAGTAYPIACSAGGSFGKTDTTDIVAFLGKTAAEDNGVASCFEFNGSAWATGNSLTRARRTTGACGSTGNGLTTNGYDGSFRDYTDTFSRPGKDT